ncbi:MAG: hypothetical protein H6740_00890 [Alphaproteobacteria bacterium]|nr:hypothetical protein [Alphaproteobacteria bacterium]
MLPLLLLACASDERPATYLVVDGEAGVYALAERSIPELEDPRAMWGSLGDGHRGGAIEVSLFAEQTQARYTGGGRVELLYTVEDGLGLPLDEDGLILWSFYHTLSRADAELAPLIPELDAVFPVDFAYQPAYSVMELSSGTNAAYISGGAHLFMLLPDMMDGPVPIAANPAVIRHELGHALFRALGAGDPRAQAPWDDQVDAVPVNCIRALDEGFADMLSTLSLQDPDVLAASIPGLDTRDVREGWTATEDLYPTADSAALLFDPYALGTVYASLAWDLRDLVEAEGGDPVQAPLLAVMEATRRWQEEAAWSDPDRWAALLIEVTDEEAFADTAALCAAYATRLPLAATPELCR